MMDVDEPFAGGRDPNAAILAAQILSVGDAALRQRLAAYRGALAAEVEDRARRVADKLKSRG